MEAYIEKFKEMIQGREKLVTIIALIIVTFLLLSIFKGLFFSEAKAQMKVDQASVKAEYLKVAVEISKICNSDKNCIKAKIKEIDDISNNLNTKLKK